MISMNYINGIIKKEKYGGVFVKVIKLLNLLVQLLIIFFIVSSININNKVSACNNKISKIKSSIEEKRTANNIEDKEKLWNTYYYKLLAVKEQLHKNTNYCLVITELGTYFPKDVSILSLSCVGNELKMSVYVQKSIIETLNSFYDYSNILKSAFEKCAYIKKDDVLIESVANTDSFVPLKDKSGNVLEVKLSILSRK